MSHFCVLVIGNAPDEQLAKYDENLEVDMHLVATKEQLIERNRKFFAEHHYWTDEECYENAVSCYRDDIKNGADYCEIHEDGSLWMTVNDQNSKWDWYQQGGRFRGLLKLKEPSDDAPLYDGWQFRNDRREYERLKQLGFCDQAVAKDVSNIDSIIPFAVVKDGEWHERAGMGWWCCTFDEKEKDVWESEVKGLLSDVQGNTLLTVIDCHI